MQTRSRRIYVCAATVGAALGGVVLGIATALMGAVAVWLFTTRTSRPPAPAPALVRAQPLHASAGQVVNALETPGPRFRGQLDAKLLAPLRSQPLTRVKINTRGSSLSLRLDFADGSRAAFKPEQIHPQSKPHREIAAYRMNTLLGLSAVPPAMGRAFALSDLKARLIPEQAALASRLDKEATCDGDVVRGELSWWIPEIKEATIEGLGVDERAGMALWQSQLSIEASLPPTALAQQISNMVLFDFLINNTDRWSGDNVLSSADGAFIYFMDNTLSFGNDPRGHENPHRMLTRVQKFSRELYARLHRLSEAEVRAALRDSAPFAELLSDGEIHALMARRDLALQYIEDLIAQHGAGKVLAFP